MPSSIFSGAVSPPQGLATAPFPCTLSPPPGALLGAGLFRTFKYSNFSEIHQVLLNEKPFFKKKKKSHQVQTFYCKTWKRAGIFEMSFQIILGERKKKVHPLSREMKLLSHQGKCFTGPCSPGCAEWHPWKCFMPSPILGQQGKHPGSSTRAGSAFYLHTRQGYKSYSKWRRMAGSNLEPNQKKRKKEKRKAL